MWREPFYDRSEAGKELARKLAPYANRADVVVLGLARGGIPVAYEVATSLGAPLDVFIVRKIGLPGHPEFALGAIASGGAYHLNEEVLSQVYVSESALEATVAHEKEELQRREALYRAGQPPLDLKHRRVILVDDGLATGASMLAAVRAVKKMDPKEIIVAVPVIALASVADMEREVDHLVYVSAPAEFYAVGEWYVNFGQTTDEEVKEWLSLASSSDIRKVKGC